MFLREILSNRPREFPMTNYTPNYLSTLILAIQISFPVLDSFIDREDVTYPLSFFLFLSFYSVHLLCVEKKNLLCEFSSLFVKRIRNTNVCRFIFIGNFKIYSVDKNFDDFRKPILSEDKLQTSMVRCLEREKRKREQNGISIITLRRDRRVS